MQCRGSPCSSLLAPTKSPHSNCSAEPGTAVLGRCRGRLSAVAIKMNSDLEASSAGIVGRRTRGWARGGGQQPPPHAQRRWAEAGRQALGAFARADCRPLTAITSQSNIRARCDWRHAPKCEKGASFTATGAGCGGGLQFCSTSWLHAGGKPGKLHAGGRPGKGRQAGRQAGSHATAPHALTPHPATHPGVPFLATHHQPGRVPCRRTSLLVVVYNNAERLLFRTAVYHASENQKIKSGQACRCRGLLFRAEHT